MVIGEPDFLRTLRLEDTGAATRERVFTGENHWSPGGRVFGGQVLAQCVVAAQATIEDRAIHSLHGYFLRPGDIHTPITFGVEQIHDGRSFATRRAQAYQKGVPIFSMIASFQTEDAGVEHQDPFPVDIPSPESLAHRRLDPRDDRPPRRAGLGRAGHRPPPRRRAGLRRRAGRARAAPGGVVPGQG